jgi:hypothetical protein
MPYTLGSSNFVADNRQFLAFDLNGWDGLYTCGGRIRLIEMRKIGWIKTAFIPYAN